MCWRRGGWVIIVFQKEAVIMMFFLVSFPSQRDLMVGNGGGVGWGVVVVMGVIQP